MCDYSAKAVKQREAAKDDVLVSHALTAHTRGFVGITDPSTAVCLLPGTQLAFDKPVEVESTGLRSFIAGASNLGFTVATFCQVEKDNSRTHHDALEFPDGTTVKLNTLLPGQTATVIQLPVDPKTLEGQARRQAEAQQRRAEYI